MKALLIAVALGIASPLAAQCQLEEWSIDHIAGFYGGAISVSGERALVGAELFGLDLAGRAFVVEYTASGFDEVKELTAPNPTFQEEFGNSVALDGERALVGSNHGQPSTFAGAAYLFERGDGSWPFVQKLQASSPIAYAQFGESCALQGDVAVVGAPGIGVPFPGLAYVFERQPSGEWLQTATLEPGVGFYDNFGIDVAIDGDRIVVGALFAGGLSGGAFVFEKVSGAWVRTASLYGSDPSNYDWMGHAVDVEGDRIVVGSPRTELPGGNGVVYVFERSGGSWIEVQKIPGTSGRDGLFGFSLDLDGDLLAVGGPDEALSTAKEPYAEVFERRASGFEVVGAMDYEGSTYLQRFGYSVALWNGAVLVGEPGASPSGAVKLYALSDRGVMVATPDPVSLSNDDEQHFYAASCSIPGTPYLVVGSVTGTAPGVVVGGVPIPLVLDGYSLVTLTQPGLTLDQGFGAYDNDGKAYPSFHLPPVTDPTMIGAMVHHAAVTLSGSGALDYASLPVTATLVP